MSKLKDYKDKIKGWPCKKEGYEGHRFNICKCEVCFLDREYNKPLNIIENLKFNPAEMIELDVDKLHKFIDNFIMKASYQQLVGKDLAQAIVDSKDVVKQVELDLEKLVRFMHDKYEEQAKLAGWKTQESCQVGFDNLPEDNKKVMYAVGREIIKAFKAGGIRK